MRPGQPSHEKERNLAEVLDLVQGVKSRLGCSCLEQYDILGPESVPAQTRSQELRVGQAITQARTLSVLAAFSERDLFTDNDRLGTGILLTFYSPVAFSCQSFLNKACHLKMARRWAPLFYLALFLSLATGPAQTRFFTPIFPSLSASRTSSCPHLLSHPASTHILSPSKDGGV